MTKSHFAPMGDTFGVCGRNGRTTKVASQVSCLSCRKQPEYDPALEAEKIAREAAIEASPARKVSNPWSGGDITCQNCGNDTFKDAGRSLFSNNHKCAQCGHMNHTTTETGMCT